MLRRIKPLARISILALVLVAGSVQAQISYFCNLLDAPMQMDMETDDHDHGCCPEIDAEEIAADDNERCCDESVDLLVETTTEPAQNAAKPIKPDSDADPPGILVALVSPLHFATDLRRDFRTNDAATLSLRGNETYLITQRLRI